MIKKVIRKAWNLSKLGAKSIWYLPALPFSIYIAKNNALREHNNNKEIVPCYVCGSSDSSLRNRMMVKSKYFAMYEQREKISHLYYSRGYLGNAVRFFNKKYFRLDWLVCDVCGNAFQNYPHTNQTLFKYYSKFSDERPVFEIPENTKKVKTLAAKYFIDQTGLKPPERILDVGAAIGLACKYLQDLGYEAWGVEPSSQRVEFARKSLGLKDFIHGLYDESSFQNEYFDGILCHHVLEHVLMPLDIIKAFNNHLKIGGYLLLQLPALEEDRTATTQCDHLVAYCLDGIISLLNKYGFDVVEAIIVPKDFSKIPKAWRVKDENISRGWTTQGVIGGAMSILAKKQRNILNV